MSNELLQGLNEKQVEAVQVVEGPLIVIAGAGSGKTRVLTHRIAYLIREHKVRPENILAVTFTNKAADEMRERLRNLLGMEMKKGFSYGMPVVGTFHAFGVQMLRREIHNVGWDNGFLIYDDTDQLALIRRITRELDLDGGKKNKPKAFMGAISWAKSRLLTAEQFAGQAMNQHQKDSAEVYLKYERVMRQRGALDFDDLIFMTVRVLRECPEVLAKYQERFKYISVDEYQDTNFAQHELTKLLAAKYKNLCVIGDTDQSIYSWRGAQFENLLNFKHDYPEAVVIKLEQNYRSTQNILSVGNAVISQNKKRDEKNLWTENEGGEPVYVEVHDTEQEEAAQVIAKIKWLNENHGVRYRDCAVLYRLSAQSRAVEEACLKAGIPYKLVGGVKFYARKEIKDLLAYARLARYASDDESFVRVVNVPARKIGATSLAHLQVYAAREGVGLVEAAARADEVEALRAPAREALKKFAGEIDELSAAARKLPVSGVLQYVNEELGYRKYLNDGTEEGETRWENVQELLGVAKKYDSLEAGVSLATFLEDAALLTSLDEVDSREDSLTLMTLHSAKGLEFPVVFIVGVEDGILPHSRAHFEPEQMEEERRLFYVGVTRAKEWLFLLRARRRMFYGGQNNPASRFLTDLPRENVSRDEEIAEEEMEFLERLKDLGRRKNGWY